MTASPCPVCAQAIIEGGCKACGGTGRASPAPTLLTKEQLEPLLSKLRTPNSVSVLSPTHIFAPNEAAALLQHIAALEQRVEAISAVMCHSFDGQDRTYYLRANGRQSFVEAVDAKLAALPKEPPRE